MAEGEAESNAVAAGSECSNRSSRMNGLAAIDPKACWAPEQDCEGGLDEAGEIQPRNCYRPHREPTRENIDALFRDVDDMVKWDEAGEIQPRNCYRPPWEPTRENIDALFRDVDDTVRWMRSQNYGEEPPSLLPIDDRTSELDALFREVDEILELDRLAPWDQDQGSAQELVGDRAEQVREDRVQRSTSEATATPAAAREAPLAAFGPVGLPGLGVEPGAWAGRETELMDWVARYTRGSGSEGSGPGEDDRLTLRSVE